MSQVRKFQPGGSVPETTLKGKLTINGTVHDMNDPDEYQNFVKWVEASPNENSTLVMRSILNSINSGYDWDWEGGNISSNDTDFYVKGMNPKATERASKSVSRTTANARAFFNTDAHKINEGAQRLGSYYYHKPASSKEEGETKLVIKGGDNKWWRYSAEDPKTKTKRLLYDDDNADLSEELDLIKLYFENEEEASKTYELSPELKANADKIRRFKKKLENDGTSWSDYIKQLQTAILNNSVSEDQESVLNSMLFSKKAPTATSTTAPVTGTPTTVIGQGSGSSQIVTGPKVGSSNTYGISWDNAGNVTYSASSPWKDKAVYLEGIPEFAGTKWANGAIVNGKLYTHDELINSSSTVNPEVYEKFNSVRVNGNYTFADLLKAWDKSGIIYNKPDLANYGYDNDMWYEELGGAPLLNTSHAKNISNSVLDASGNPIADTIKVVEYVPTRKYNNEIGTSTQYYVYNTTTKKGTIYNSLAALNKAGYKIGDPRTISNYKYNFTSQIPLYGIKTDNGTMRFHRGNESINIGGNVAQVFTRTSDGTKWVYCQYNGANRMFKLNSTGKNFINNDKINFKTLIDQCVERTQSKELVGITGNLSVYNPNTKSWSSDISIQKEGGSIPKYFVGGATVAMPGAQTTSDEDNPEEEQVITTSPVAPVEQASTLKHAMVSGLNEGIWDTADYLEVGGAAADLLGAIVSTAGASAVGAGMGLAGTISYTTADVMRNKQATGRTLGNGVGKRFFTNLGFDALSLIPFVGGVAEAKNLGRAAKSILNFIAKGAQYGGGAITAILTPVQLNATVQSLNNIANGKFSTEDATTLMQTLQLFVGMGNIVANKRGRTKVAESIAANKPNTGKSASVKANVSERVVVPEGTVEAPTPAYKAKAKVNDAEISLEIDPELIRGKSKEEAIELIEQTIKDKGIDPKAVGEDVLSAFGIKTKSSTGKNTKVDLDPDQVRNLNGKTVKDAAAEIRTIAAENGIDIDPNISDAKLIEAFGFKTARNSRFVLRSDEKVPQRHRVLTGPEGELSQKGFWESAVGMPYEKYIRENAQYIDPETTYTGFGKRYAKGIAEIYSPKPTETVTNTAGRSNTQESAPRVETNTQPEVSSEPAVRTQEPVVADPIVTAEPAINFDDVKAIQAFIKTLPTPSKKKKVNAQQALDALANFAKKQDKNVVAINENQAMMRDYYSKIRESLSTGTRKKSKSTEMTRSQFDTKLDQIKKKYNLSFKEGGVLRAEDGLKTPTNPEAKVTIQGIEYYRPDFCTTTEWMTIRQIAEKELDNQNPLTEDEVGILNRFIEKCSVKDTVRYQDVEKSNIENKKQVLAIIQKQYNNLKTDPSNPNKNISQGDLQLLKTAATKIYGSSNEESKSLPKNGSVDVYEGWSKEDREKLQGKLEESIPEISELSIFAEVPKFKNLPKPSDLPSEEIINSNDEKSVEEYEEKLIKLAKAKGIKNPEEFSTSNLETRLNVDKDSIDRVMKSVFQQPGKANFPVNLGQDAVEGVKYLLAHGNNKQYFDANRKSIKEARLKNRRHTLTKNSARFDDTGLLNNTEKQVAEGRVAVNQAKTNDATLNNASKLAYETNVLKAKTDAILKESELYTKQLDAESKEDSAVKQYNTKVMDANGANSASAAMQLGQIDSGEILTNYKSAENLLNYFKNNIMEDATKYKEAAENQANQKALNVYNDKLKELYDKYQDEYGANSEMQQKYGSLEEYVKQTKAAEYTTAVNAATEAAQAISADFNAKRIGWNYPHLYPKTDLFKRGGKTTQRSSFEQMMIDNNRETMRALSKLNDNIIKLFLKTVQ